jgi:hypothetical protein
MSALTRLFPPSWRRRYEREFDALLEDVPLTLTVLTDVIAAAARARLESAIEAVRHAPPGPSGSNLGTQTAERTGAVAAATCGVLWALTIAIGSIVDWGRNGRDWGSLMLIAAAAGILAAQSTVTVTWPVRGRRVAWLGVGTSCVGVTVLLMSVLAAFLLDRPWAIRLGWSPQEYWEAGMLLTLAGSALVTGIGVIAGGLPRAASALIVAATIPLALWLLIDFQGPVIHLIERAAGPGLITAAAAQVGYPHSEGWFTTHPLVTVPGMLFGLAWAAIGAVRLGQGPAGVPARPSADG